MDHADTWGRASQEAGGSGREAGAHLAHPLNSEEAAVLEPRSQGETGRDTLDR